MGWLIIRLPARTSLALERDANPSPSRGVADKRRERRCLKLDVPAAYELPRSSKKLSW